MSGIEICSYCKREVPTKDAFQYSSSLPFCTFGCCQAFRDEEGTYLDPEDFLEDEDERGYDG